MPLESGNFRKIKAVLNENRERAHKDKTERPFYRVDRSSASDYLRDHKEWQKIIETYFSDRKAQRLPIVYADICGEASATSMGATHNYSFSIKESYRRSPDMTQFKGDVFNKRDVLDFIHDIKAHGHVLNYVTFEPIVGLGGYDLAKEREDQELHRKVVWQQLENNLVLLLEVLEPGGYVYISKPFQLESRDIRDFLQRKDKTNTQGQLI